MVPKKWKFVGGVAAVALGVSGCATQAPGTDPGDSDGLSGSIEVRVYADWEFVSVYADQFMKDNPGTKIEVTGLDSDWLREQAGRVFLSSESPDVISWTLSAELYDAWGDAGALLAMDDVWKDADITDNVASSVLEESKTSSGGLFAAPLGLTITPLLYVNTDAIDPVVAAQVSADHSLDDATFNAILDGADAAGISTSGQIADVLISWTLLDACGLEVYNDMSSNWQPGGESAAKYTDACGVAAIQKLADLVTDGHFPEGLSAVNQEQSQALFLTEKSPTWLQGSWSAPVTDPSFNWTWTTLPSSTSDAEDAFMGGLDSFLIPSGSTNPDLAKAFVAYMLSKDTLETGMGRVPVRSDLDLAKVIPDAPLSREIAEAAAQKSLIPGWSHLVPVPLLNAYKEGVVDEILNGRGSAADAAAKIQDAADRFRSENG